MAGKPKTAEERVEVKKSDLTPWQVLLDGFVVSEEYYEDRTKDDARKIIASLDATVDLCCEAVRARLDRPGLAIDYEYARIAIAAMQALKSDVGGG